MSGESWGFIFLMLVMKVPIVYLAGVVWYACKPPDPPEPARMLVEAPERAPIARGSCAVVSRIARGGRARRAPPSQLAACRERVR